jgi:hypothetical protein
MEARRLKSANDAFELSLSIRHPSMDPAEISRELHMQAEHSFKAGEKRGRRRSGSTATNHAESYWLAPLDAEFWEASTLANLQPYTMEFGTLDLALVRCAYLLRRHAEFLRRVQAEGGDVTLLVSVSTDAVSGFSLTPQCAGALHALGVGVDFEFTR